MEFVKVDYVPGKGAYAVCKRQADLECFMKQNIKVAKITGWEAEYKNSTSAAETIRSTAKRFKLPITAMKRKDEVYIIRTDM